MSLTDPHADELRTIYEVASDGTELPVGGGLWRDAMRRMSRNPSALIGALLVLGFVAIAVAAPLIAPYAPTNSPSAPKACDISQIRPTFIPGPSSSHWLGLDLQGCDELSRLMYGARYSLLIGVVSLAIGAFFGLLLGLLAGAFGGWMDSLVMRLMDIMLAVPGLLFAIAIAALLGRSLTSVMIAIAVINVPIFARLLRGSMLSQREADYVLAARSVGVRRRKIVFGHVFPNSLGPVIVAGTLALGTAIIDAAALAFLGLGSADPSVPEWGRMLTDVQRFLAVAPLLALWPGLAIVLAVLGFNLLGEALRESLDPKLRR